MKRASLLLGCMLCAVNLFAQRNLFTSKWNEANLDQAIVQKWQPFPVYTSRAGWESLPRTICENVIHEAESLIGKPYDFLPLTEYLGFVRDGNRNRYEKIYFGRRSQLLQVLTAECMEGKGRFTDDIMNGVWAICEESSWCLPAHIGQPKGVPDPGQPVVDLFAAETAALLAFTDYLFGSELARSSPLLEKRLRDEVHSRVLNPFLEKDDIFWMGLQGQVVNNWNPWILSNILTSTLLLEDNREKEIKMLTKAMRCLDSFTNGYPADGGCDEGPAYWGRAGGSLFDCLETLYSASEGKINYFDDPLVKNIGQFIYKAYINAPWYINFADASAQIQPEAFLLYSYGERIHDPVLSAFGAQLNSVQTFSVSGRIESPGRSLPQLFGLEKINTAAKSWPYLRDAWLPDLQVMAARTGNGSPSGLFLAAKGGHNAESHNHNDVGNFIVYYNGQPVIIDAGVGAYTAKTFSAERYTIWSMQSQFHNLPTVNGFMQEAGRQFAADHPSYSSDDKKVSFSIGLSSCYPKDAGIEKWRRTFEFERGNKISVTDSFRLQQVKGATSWNFLTCLKPAVNADGTITLSSNGVYKTDRDIILQYSARDLDASIQQVIIRPEDGYVWKTNLSRIIITPKSMKAQGAYQFIFR
jgi:hypothetical protein